VSSLYRIHLVDPRPRVQAIPELSMSPICIACAEGHHEQPTQETCCCLCHGTIPAMQQVAA
jgi:hypothetical protein